MLLDMKAIKEHIHSASYAAFINSYEHHEDEYRPKLVYNGPDSQVLDAITKELAVCDEFWFSVAFITFGGIAAIKGHLKDIQDSGREVKGHILTTDYQDFTDPEALRSLMDLDFIDIKVAAGENFHTKGYCFKSLDPRTKEEKYTILVGSSNMTANALKVNKEWNIKTVSTSEGRYTREFLDEFNYMWSSAVELTDDWINEYKKVRAERQVIVRRIAKETESIIVPNYMQRRALEGLDKLRASGKDKGLLIAATGTGKTYLSAFDVKEFNPSRMLYVVHREQILDKAIESFEQVLGRRVFSDNVGKYSGRSKERDKKYTFATIQSMLQKGVMESFGPEYFDYIIVDEVHKAGADKYQEFMKYFKPKFLLGMSATPDRTDKVNIYEMFDYNIAYEIRLKDAMAADLVCPFNYYGVTDITVDGKLLDDNSDFKYLASEERVDRVLENARFYGFDGDNLMGLIFCSRKEEGKELSRIINEQPYNFERNYRSVFLCGEDSIEERENAIERLALPESNPLSLDYIITVDIFNEGIDIPNVNQVIMLRPTESAIIFTQQLGRGLRKANGKNTVVVIDFIGNYENNFLIPIALFGDNSYDKDIVRRYVAEGTRMIPGASTLHFDHVSKERIYDSIDRGKFMETKLIKASYQELKNKLGRIPTMADFDTYNAYNILNIVGKFGSYYAFLDKYDKEYTVKLPSVQEKMLRFISSKYCSGKSREELNIIKDIMDGKDYHERGSYQALQSAERGLAFEFSVSTERDSFNGAAILDKINSSYAPTKSFVNALNNPDFYELLEDAVGYGINKNDEVYKEKYRDTNLVLNEKYSYEDVCRLLNWDMNESAVIGGYKHNAKTDTFVVFINYDKEDDAINYEDGFIDPKHLIAMSKKNRPLDCKDKKIIYREEYEGISYKDTKFYLFVRKNKLEEKSSKDFYFLGEINAVGEPIPKTLETGEPLFEICYELETPVRDDIYEYIQTKV